MAPKNGKCDFPTLQATPFLLSPEIQQANESSSRFTQKQSRSGKFMPFFKQFGKSWFEKNFKMTSFIHKLSTNGNTAYSKSITIKMIHDPSVIFPLIFYCQRHRYDLNTLLPKTRGVPWVGCSGGGCGYPHTSPSFTAAQGMLHSPHSMCQVLGPPARTTAWATLTSTASAHSITLKMSIIRRHFPFPDVAISTFP